MRRLLLFDVDGTLLRCGAQVRPLFLGALEQVFGVRPEVDGYSFSGRTDPQITLDLLRGAGMAEEVVLPRLAEMREVYRERLAGGLRVERMELLPGVRELLERLSRRDDLLLGLLTGNWRDCAAVKLSRFGLEPFFPFGAFGDDGVERSELLPVALERAAELAGRAFAPEEVLIVGDSVRDVDCARSGGVASLAVASGFHSAAELRGAGADWVFPDLDHAGREHALLSLRG